MPIQKSADLIADACLPRKYVEELRDMGYDVLYINEIDGSMPDSSVKRIGYELDIPIATCNVRHFQDYDKLIPLRPRKQKKLISETLKYLE